jgi:hypothetical protein
MIVLDESVEELRRSLNLCRQGKEKKDHANPNYILSAVKHKFKQTYDEVG